MFEQLKQVLVIFESTLSDIQNRGLGDNFDVNGIDNIDEHNDETEIAMELKDNLHHVTSYIEANFLHPQNSYDNYDNVQASHFELQKSVLEEYPEASQYLGEDFVQNYITFKKELEKPSPNEQEILAAGTEILQRLKSFSKVSSPSTF